MAETPADVSSSITVGPTVQHEMTVTQLRKAHKDSASGDLWIPLFKSEEEVEAHQPLMLVKMEGVAASEEATVATRAVAARSAIAGLMGLIPSATPTMSVGAAHVPPGFTHFYTLCAAQAPRRKVPAGTLLLRRAVSMDAAVAEGSAMARSKDEAAELAANLLRKGSSAQPRPRMRKKYVRGKTGGLQLRWEPIAQQQQQVAPLPELHASDVSDELGGGEAASSTGCGSGSSEAVPGVLGLLHPTILNSAGGGVSHCDDGPKKRGRDGDEALTASEVLLSHLEELHRVRSGRRLEAPLERAVQELREQARAAARAGVTRRRTLNKLENTHAKQSVAEQRALAASDARPDIHVCDTVWRRPNANLLMAIIGPFVARAGARSSFARSRVAAFGIEGTILRTSLFERGPDAWSPADPAIGARLSELDAMGHHIVFFQNYPSLHGGGAYHLAEKTGRIVGFVKKHCPDIPVSVVLSVVSHGAAEHSTQALPHPDVFKVFVRGCNMGVQPDRDFSFFVGTLDGALKEAGDPGTDKGMPTNEQEGSDGGDSDSPLSLFSDTDDSDGDTETTKSKKKDDLGQAMLDCVGPECVATVDDTEKRFAENIGLRFYHLRSLVARKLPCW